MATWSCLQSLVCSHIPGSVVYKGVNAPHITKLCNTLTPQIKGMPEPIYHI